MDLNKLSSNKKFVRFMFAHTLQGLVFTAFAVTEQWYVVNELNASVWLGVVMMATAFPRLIFMLMGGALTDRFSNVKIILFSNFSRIFIAGIIFLSSMFLLSLRTRETMISKQNVSVLKQVRDGLVYVKHKHTILAFLLNFVDDQSVFRRADRGIHSTDCKGYFT